VQNEELYSQYKDLEAYVDVEIVKWAGQTVRIFSFNVPSKCTYLAH